VRVLADVENIDPEQFGPLERWSLRTSLDRESPHRHADFLIAVARTLLYIEDVVSVPHLEKLVERSTVSKKYVREAGDLYSGETRLAPVFKGTPEEAEQMRRVRSAANVACERLKMLAEKAAPSATLLRPVNPETKLLRPASASRSQADHLLRPRKPDDEAH
jgi:hypothetical protein